MSNTPQPEISTAERELAERGVYVTSTIGHSMEPFLSHRRDAVVISAPTREVKKYDVVLYPGPGGIYVLHRVIAVKGDTLVIRGDNTYRRELVPRDNILGIMTAFTRKGKHGEITDLSYRLYSRVRCASYPLRSALRYLYLRLARAYRRVFPRGGRGR